MKFSEWKSKELKKDDFKKEYERQTPYWQIQQQLIDARIKSKLTQRDIAEKMNVTQSAVARFEKQDRCNINTLIEYARAVGMKQLVIDVN